MSSRRSAKKNTISYGSGSTAAPAKKKLVSAAPCLNGLPKLADQFRTYTPEEMKEMTRFDIDQVEQLLVLSRKPEAAEGMNVNKYAQLDKIVQTVGAMQKSLLQKAST